MKGLSENKEMRGVQIGLLFVLFAICIVWLAKQQLLPLWTVFSCRFRRTCFRLACACLQGKHLSLAY